MQIQDISATELSQVIDIDILKIGDQLLRLGTNKEEVIISDNQPSAEPDIWIDTSEPDALVPTMDEFMALMDRVKELEQKTITVNGNGSSDNSGIIFDIIPPTEGGLYDANGNLICSFAESGIDPSKDVNLDNLDFDSAQMVLLSFPACRGIAVSASYTSIGAKAFDGTGLDFIFVPDTVTQIANDAFNTVQNVKYYGAATGSPWGAAAVNQ